MIINVKSQDIMSNFMSLAIATSSAGEQIKVFERSRRRTSILGFPARLKPSVIIISTQSPKEAVNSSMVLSEVIFLTVAILSGEEMTTILAPASLCLKLSLPGRSISKWWASCLMEPTL